MRAILLIYLALVSIVQAQTIDVNNETYSLLSIGRFGNPTSVQLLPPRNTYTITLPMISQYSASDPNQAIEIKNNSSEFFVTEDQFSGYQASKGFGGSASLTVATAPAGFSVSITYKNSGSNSGGSGSSGNSSSTNSGTGGGTAGGNGDGGYGGGYGGGNNGSGGYYGNGGGNNNGSKAQSPNSDYPNNNSYASNNSPIMTLPNGGTAIHVKVAKPHTNNFVPAPDTPGVIHLPPAPSKPVPPSSTRQVVPPKKTSNLPLYLAVLAVIVVIGGIIYRNSNNPPKSKVPQHRK